jgi:hypothetical protein
METEKVAKPNDSANSSTIGRYGPSIGANLLAGGRDVDEASRTAG